jgi:hypothetical protein
LKLLARQNRKLGRTVDHLQKRKPFIRLSFGEKHEIAKYITQFPDKTYPEYARYFSELWNRTVTARQIITTKENTDKWLDEAYKGCEQTHYKFVDEGSEQDGPMVMKRKRSRVILTPDEREEISNFLADNSEMTFNQTAEIFARRWGKDVNRTHVASIMRLREKASHNTNSSNSNLAITNGIAPPPLFRKAAKAPTSNSFPPSMLPQTSMAMKTLPMSGLDLFNLNNDTSHASTTSTTISDAIQSTVASNSTSAAMGSSIMGGLHTSPVTAALAAAQAHKAHATLGTPPVAKHPRLSPAFTTTTASGAAPISVITPNHNIFMPNGTNLPQLPSNSNAAATAEMTSKPSMEPPLGMLPGQMADLTHRNAQNSHENSRTNSPNKTKIDCEKCPAAFECQAALIQHILSTPNHLIEKP